MARRLVAVGKRCVLYEDYVGVEAFGLSADGFFGGRDERRHEHSAVGRSMEPFVAQARILVRRIAAVDYHLALERIVQQELIAVSLICVVADFHVIHPSEKFGMLPPHRQPVRILTNVAEECVKRAVVIDYLVVESLGEYRALTESLIDLYFQAGYNIAERYIDISLNK